MPDPPAPADFRMRCRTDFSCSTPHPEVWSRHSIADTFSSWRKPWDWLLWIIGSIFQYPYGDLAEEKGILLMIQAHFW